MARSEANAKLTVTLFHGFVNPRTCHGKVRVEIRLSGESAAFNVANVDSSSGKFTQEPEQTMVVEDNLESIWNDHLNIVLCSWHPAREWTDAASMKIPIRSIGLSDEGEKTEFVLENVMGDNARQEDKPVVFMRATLTSQFRRPVQSVARLLDGYTSTVDRALDVVSYQARRIEPFLKSRYALVPAIPVGVIILASLPLVIVLGIAGLPLVLPLLVVVASLGAVGALLVGAVWAGSRGGRAKLQEFTKPVMDRVSHNDPEVLYPIGPRPSPQRVARSLMPTTIWPKLAMSVMIDAIGSSSYLVPVLGEAADLVWAPMALILIDAMYHESSPWAGWLGALEEVLPFTDIIPTATLAWIKEYGVPLARGHYKLGSNAYCGDFHASNGGSTPEYTFAQDRAHAS